MLHLFNKVYLAFDDSIDCHTNRYVISAETGNEMHQELPKTHLNTLGAKNTFKLYGFRDWPAEPADRPAETAENKKK